jgi:hypothetical protein
MYRETSFNVLRCSFQWLFFREGALAWNKSKCSGFLPAPFSRMNQSIKEIPFPTQLSAGPQKKPASL